MKFSKKFLLVTICLLVKQKATSQQTLPCQLHDGTTCPSKVCPNDTIKFDCTSQITPDNRTYWTLRVDYTEGYCKGIVYVGQTVPSGSLTCTDSAWMLDCESLLGLPVVYFNVTDMPPDTNGTCLGSVLSLDLSSDYIITGVEVICANTSVPFGGIPYLSYGEASIKVIVRPNPPIIISVESTRGPQTNITVVWATPPAGYMPTSYIVSVDDVTMAPVSIVATTAMQYSYTFSGLRNDRLYTVAVVAVNCGGNSDPAYPTSGTSSHIGAILGITAGTIIGSLLLVVGVIAVTRKAYKKARIRTHANNTSMKYAVKSYDSVNHM